MRASKPIQIFSPRKKGTNKSFFNDGITLIIIFRTFLPFRSKKKRSGRSSLIRPKIESKHREGGGGAVVKTGSRGTRFGRNPGITKIMARGSREEGRTGSFFSSLCPFIRDRPPFRRRKWRGLRETIAYEKIERRGETARNHPLPSLYPLSWNMHRFGSIRFDVTREDRLGSLIGCSVEGEGRKGRDGVVG